ncbi:hypothetical protein E2C01_010431 [Portunus trituberculatus]|uniref:Uncharacterized protein n=1 Tax=Portunus trituberculatus TaxID=210409 RepID=A0A5B7D8C4_PORTR|nr:hypothetical protein [Portunus trituberculatus]
MDVLLPNPVTGAAVWDAGKQNSQRRERSRGDTQPGSETVEIKTPLLNHGTEAWLLFAPNSSANQANIPMRLGIRPTLLEAMAVQASCSYELLGDCEALWNP